MASIIRVINFTEVNVLDITYTMVNASMWSTIEQSIGIICACLITYQPLLSRVLSFFNCESPTTARNQQIPSRSYELANLKMSPLKPSLGESTAGFARLGEHAGTESAVTTHVTMAGADTITVVSEGIVSNQTIEQHRDHTNNF